MIKRIITITILLIIILSLAGCKGDISNITINEDGSGTATIKIGMTEEGINIAENSDKDITIDTSNSFEYNNQVYYGEIKTFSFKNIDELNNKFKTEILKISKDSSLIVSKTNSGDFIIDLTLGIEDIKNAHGDEFIKGNSFEEQLAREKLLKSSSIILEFNLPYTITQNLGISKGVIIKDNKLTLDFITMAEPFKAMKEQKYNFSTNFYSQNTINNTINNKKIFFKDVYDTDWYYKSVMFLADGTLITGIGDDLFAPNDTLTYAQFCQILAKAKKLPAGKEYRYWAYKSIDSCIKAGYIPSLGDINIYNYDIPIPREVAISAIYKAKSESLTEIKYKNISIPDQNKIAKRYREDIINAYKYGIVTGSDKSGTFNPKSFMTRAEICQVFYNLNWYKPEEIK